MKTALVLGGTGTIGHQLVKRLKRDGYYVVAADRKENEFCKSYADEFIECDLCLYSNVSPIFYNRTFDFVFMLAAEMGGSTYVFTGENDSEIIHNSALMNLNVASAASKHGCGVIFFASSACCYSESLQMTNTANALPEVSAWEGGKPDSIYGIEKLFSEQVYDAFRRNEKLNIRIGRFHNVFSTEAVYKGGREKFPAAICRKISDAQDGDTIEIFGDGKQVRSFLWVDEAIEGILRLVASDYQYPVNIGSDYAISITDLAKMVIKISGKDLGIEYVPSNAIGVMGRNSDNTLIKEVLNWSPTQPLEQGMTKLYHWINRVNGKS